MVNSSTIKTTEGSLAKADRLGIMQEVEQVWYGQFASGSALRRKFDQRQLRIAASGIPIKTSLSPSF